MTWHTETVAAAGLVDLLAMIRRAGGVVTSSCPDIDKVRVTWTSSSTDSTGSPR